MKSLLRVLEQFGRGHGSLDLLLPLGAVFVVDADCGFQFFFPLFFTAHVNQDLSAEVVNRGTIRIDFVGGVDLR